jgi:hypothetical protein
LLLSSDSSVVCCNAKNVAMCLMLLPADCPLVSRLKNLFGFYTYTIYNQYLWSTNHTTLDTHYNCILIYN